MPKKTFDKIGESWYNVRHYPQPHLREDFEELADRWQRGRLLAVGCAHGSDLLPFKDLNLKLHGTDISRKLIELSQKYFDKHGIDGRVSVGDAKKLPYEDNTFNYLISIATLHHIRGREERLKALGEMMRVLKPSGECFLTVFNRWNWEFWFRGKEIYKTWGKEKLKRYYYLYNYRELRRDLKEAGFGNIKLRPETEYKLPFKLFSRNICAELKN
ncbi:MAG: class I SAM-dependent methyltransferase [Candidatus Aenigmatarchaeota archaeon]